MRRLSINDVKQYALQKGYILIDGDYKNSSTKMHWCDKEGYNYYSSYEKIKSGNPERFSLYNPYTMDNIRHYLEQHHKDYKYVSGVYENQRSKLDWVDSNGYKYYASFNDICRGVRFVSSHNKYSIDNIHRYIEINHTGDMLLSNSYYSNGTHQKTKEQSNLLFRCPKGHDYSSSWSNYQQGRRCPKCARRYTNRDEFVKLVYETKGDEYQVIGEYVNSQTKILMRHNVCGTEFYKEPNSFMQGHCCPNNVCCKRRGKDHYKWNEKLTDEDRKNNQSRLTMLGYKKWRKDVFKRDGHRCVICGARFSTNNKLIPHHLNSWDQNIEERFDVENGITLCTTHHKLFHSLYGYGKNTKEQFNEFIKNNDNTEVNNQIAKG